ncbi:hypothetical protein [Litorimonas haliclonae]|uniref:hypothetical protein n=1 Tax=Litorimonas haliclonae TaxID=2081977 RepID=UPI0039F0A149
MNQSTPLPNKNEEKARHLLKTAVRANKSENYKREVELLEQAIIIMPEVTPHVLRRYASALYKTGEYRAAALIAFDEQCTGDNGEDFVNRLKDSLEKRGAELFVDVAERCQF